MNNAEVLRNALDVMQSAHTSIPALADLDPDDENFGRFSLVGVVGWEGYRISGRAAVVDGRRQVIDVAVERLPDAEPVALTGERLGKLPLRALAAFAISKRHDSGPSPMKLFPALAALGKADPDSSDVTRQIERAAGVWTRLRDEGARPLRRRAAEELKVSEATLDRYLRRARELNLIATPERPSPEELVQLRRDGLTAKDIAERFERRVATINSWIYRARRERPDLDWSRAASARREEN